MQKETKLLFDEPQLDSQAACKLSSKSGSQLDKASDLEFEFLPEYLDVLERPPSSVARFFIAGIVALGIITLLWASIGRIDIIASAPGRLIIDDRSKVIQAPDLGEVSQIAVKDGQVVVKGELLIAFNPTTTTAESQRLSNQLVTIELEVARVNALLQVSSLLKSDPFLHFLPPKNASLVHVEAARENLLADYNNQAAQTSTLQSQIEQNQLQLKLSSSLAKESQALISNAKERLKVREQLRDSGYIPRYDYLELEKEVIEESRDAAQLRIDAAVLASESVNLQQQLVQLQAENRKTLLDRLTELTANQVDVSKQLVQANERLRKMRVLAPVDGVVQQLSVHTIGGVVQSGQELMVLVPEGATLEAEVNILNKDVGFIRPGQLVEVKVDSFPYTKYGTIKGEVVNVSLDSLEDEKIGLVYPARIRLAAQTVKTDAEEIALSAGMMIAAEIKTGDRRVIDYLLSPLKEYQSESLKER